MSTVKKKTLIEMFNELLPLCETEEQKAFILDRIDKTARKNTDRKPTEQQLTNKKRAEELLDFMKANPNTMFRVAELIKKAPCFNSMDYCSINYANAIVQILRKEESITRTEVKGNAYYQYAE